MNDLLMLTFAWPPHINSGVWRPAKFARYLPRFNWRPTVLAASGWGAFGTQGMARVEPQGWPGCQVVGVESWGDRQLAGEIGRASCRERV